jgi:hypothetical protein
VRNPRGTRAWESVHRRILVKKVSFASLVAVDRDRVPHAMGTSHYVRPVIVATEPFLGVRPAARYLHYAILSLVGAYYPLVNVA